jgi:signal transduction histidine kinase
MNRLWVRLTVVFLLVALLAVGVISIAVGRVTSASFRAYVSEEAAQEMAFRLEEYYAATGSWDGAEALLFGQGAGGGMGRGHMGGGGGMGLQGGGMMGNRNARFLLADTVGRVLADTDGTAIGSMLSEPQQSLAVALEADGETVGWLVAETPGSIALTATQQHFLEDVSLSLRLAVGGAVIIAIVAGSLLAWQLTNPLRQLTLAALRMAEGDIGSQVTMPSGSFREVADLADAFNNMSLALAEGDALRQRMAADIAHELRTPVSVMRGQLEGIMDGILPADTNHIAVVYNQTLHLSRLVDDLRTLTMAEAGHLPLALEAVNPESLVEQVVQSFQPAAQDAGLALTKVVSPELSPMRADADRIRQVLANLIANALRHTDDRGTITVSAEETGGHIRFSVANNGSTLTPEQAKYVFERFWRADEARDRDRGGAGLGLAISRELVHLHAGRIWVEPGNKITTFLFEIPTSPMPPQSEDDASSSASSRS